MAKRGMLRGSEEWLQERLARSATLAPANDLVQPSSRAAPKPFKLTKYEPREADILPSILEALRLHKAVANVWRVNSGAGRLQRSDGTVSQFLRFGFPGCPDIHGYLRTGKALYVECKRPSGDVRQDQVAFIANAKKSGCAAFVARGVDDVFRELGRELA